MRMSALCSDMFARAEAQREEMFQRISENAARVRAQPPAWAVRMHPGPNKEAQRWKSVRSRVRSTC